MLGYAPSRKKTCLMFLTKLKSACLFTQNSLCNTKQAVQQQIEILCIEVLQSMQRNQKCCQISLCGGEADLLLFLFVKKVSSFITWPVLQRVRFLIICHMAIAIHITQDSSYETISKDKQSAYIS